MLRATCGDKQQVQATPRLRGKYSKTLFYDTHSEDFNSRLSTSFHRLACVNGCVEAGNFNEGTIISDQNVANTGCAKHIDLRGRQKH